MREPKFRAYIKPLKRYATGLDTIQFHKCCDVAGAGIWTVVTVNEGIFEDDDIIIEQYTGLKDKNGKEIYEGDILQIDDHILGDFEVLWNNLAWKIKMSFGYETLYVHKPENIVVIGNIHENHELLK